MAFNRKPQFRNIPLRNQNAGGTDIFELFFVVVFCLVIAGFISMPVIGYFRIVSLQRILETECGQNYALLDVAFNGDTLLTACKIKNQTITIK